MHKIRVHIVTITLYNEVNSVLLADVTVSVGRVLMVTVLLFAALTTVVMTLVVTTLVVMTLVDTTAVVTALVVMTLVDTTDERLDEGSVR